MLSHESLPQEVYPSYIAVISIYFYFYFLRGAVCCARTLFDQPCHVVIALFIGRHSWLSRLLGKSIAVSDSSLNVLGGLRHCRRLLSAWYRGWVVEVDLHRVVVMIQC